MAENKQENKNDLRQDQASAKPIDGELDAAGKSLANALRISFAILKVIMVTLVILFLASGFRTVASDEQALVLRFGKIRGVGEKRILGPGAHWIFPYPIDQIARIPTAKKVGLAVNSFWYYKRPSERLPGGPADKERPPEPTLDPVRDGYCLTRSERQSKAVRVDGGSDYNIVHSKWQLTYQIDDPELFFRNIYVRDVKPGQSYFDVMVHDVSGVLRNLVEDAVVTAMVNYTIDEASSSDYRIAQHVHLLLQEKLEAIESGIKVVTIQLVDIIWPRQVDAAFQALITASQKSQTARDEAETYAEKTLNEAGGPVAERLVEVLSGSENASDEEKELLWSRLEGQAQEIIAQARAYKTEIVEHARANAQYLHKILPEYRKRPELVIHELYRDAIEHFLDNVDEMLVVQPTETDKGKEIRVLISRDPGIKLGKKEE